MKSVFRFLIAATAIFTVCLASVSVIIPTNNYAWADLPTTNFYTRSSAKVDLNNANVQAFSELKGMYPNIAKIIVENAPYDSLDDVLNIPGLTEAQKQRIQENKDNLTLKRQDPSLNRERINNSLYRL